MNVASIKTLIVADCLGSGQSHRQALEIVNLHGFKNKQPKLSKSVIQRLINEMKPKICTIVRKKQGSRDPDSKWSRARYNWTTHLLVRFGKLPSQADPTTNLVPPWFNADKVEPLELSQVVWWNKTH